MLTYTFAILMEPFGFHAPDIVLFAAGLLCLWLLVSAFRYFLRRKPNLAKRRELIFQLVSKRKRIEAALTELILSRKELDRIRDRIRAVTKKVQELMELDESPLTGLAHGLVAAILSLGESLLFWLLCAAAALFGLTPSFWAFASPLCAAAWVLLLHMVIFAIVADKDRPARTIARAKVGACATGMLVVAGVWMLLSGRNLTDPNIVAQIAGTGLILLTALLAVCASFCTIVAMTVLEAQRHGRELEHLKDSEQDYLQHIEELERDITRVRAASNKDDDADGASADAPVLSPTPGEIKIEVPAPLSITNHNGTATIMLLTLLLLGYGVSQGQAQVAAGSSKISTEAPTGVSAPLFARDGACEFAVDVSGSVPRDALRESLARLSEQLDTIATVFDCSLFRLTPFVDLFVSIKEIPLTPFEPDSAAGCMSSAPTKLGANQEALKRAYPGIDWERPRIEACMKEHERSRDKIVLQRRAEISHAAEGLRALGSVAGRGPCTSDQAAERARLRSKTVIVLTDGLLFGCSASRRSRPEPLSGQMFFLLLVPPADGSPDRANQLLDRLGLVQQHFPDAIPLFAPEATSSFWQGQRNRK